MEHVEPLPAMLAERYRVWRAGLHDAHEQAYIDLAIGQAPTVMIIACCDSRVMVHEMFGAAAGDYFVHRNIAAFVPPVDAPQGTHGTLSTVEYAVCVLAVRHILVIGHTGCGGVEAAHDLCAGRAPHLARQGSFVGGWLRALCPSFEAVRHLPERGGCIAAMEREVVRQSLRNLLGLGFVAEAARARRLALHGALWNIGRTRLEVYDAAADDFAPLAT
jgi:carbonic anhydrase